MTGTFSSALRRAALGAFRHDDDRRSEVPSVILRAAHIYGPPDAPGPTATAMLSTAGKPVSVLGCGKQRYAWLSKSDVATGLVRAALDPGTPTGTFELAGPEPVTVNDFVRHVNGTEVRIRHLPDAAARVLGWLVPSLPGPLVDVLLQDCLAHEDPAATAAQFGITLTWLDEAWPQSA